MTILIATSTNDFDPTEVAVPWQILRNAGQKIQFATDTGAAGITDQRMLDGNRFGLLKPLLIASHPARDAYKKMLDDAAYQNPIRFENIDSRDFEAIVLPGGHAKGIIPYLESTALQKSIAEFFAQEKPIGAICHGVVPVCRAINSETGKSVLFGRKTTALLKRQEMLAYQITRWNLGDYYRTYPTTVEDEVVSTLQSPDDFLQGPTPIFRDTMQNLSRGFTVRDRNYLSARWPGDVHRFASEFLELVREGVPA